MSNGSSLPTCLAHFALACVTGWSLKHLPQQRVEGFPYVFSMLLFLLAYGLLGFVRFSLPQPGPKLRKLYERIALFARVLPIPVLNAHIFLELQRPAILCPNLLMPFCKSPSLVYVTLLTASLALVVGLVFHELHQRHIAENTATGVLLLNLAVLGLVSYDTSNYWGVGLAISFGTKHFVLPWLADRFCVPLVDLYTYGLIFYEIFAINVVIDARYLPLAPVQK